MLLSVFGDAHQGVGVNTLPGGVKITAHLPRALPAVRCCQCWDTLCPKKGSHQTLGSNFVKS